MKPTNSLPKLLGAGLVAALIVLLLVAHHSGRKEREAEKEMEKAIQPTSRVSEVSGEIVVTVDSPTLERSGIALATLEEIVRRRELQAYGVVLDGSQLAGLRAQYAGFRSQLEKAKANLQASRAEYERLKLLNDEGQQNVSLKAFQKAEAVWRTDQEEVQSAAAALSAFDYGTRQHWGGAIARWLEESAPSFLRLARGEDRLVQVTLADDAQVLDPPGHARIEVGVNRFLRADFVSSLLRTDPRIQGTSYLFVADGKAGGLIPGMNVSVFVPTGSGEQGVIVPYQAVVWVQGGPWVYVQKDSNQFVRRRVARDMPVDNGWFVRNGFKSGDRIVVQGAQLFLSEEFRAQVRVGEEEAQR